MADTSGGLELHMVSMQPLNRLAEHRMSMPASFNRPKSFNPPPREQAYEEEQPFKVAP